MTTDEALRQFEDLYAHREDLMNVRRAILALKQAQTGDPSNYEVAWRLAKLDYYLGSHSPDATEKNKAFHDGIEAGKLAVQLNNSKPDGHFWLGANYGGYAQINVLAGLADIEDIKREMEAVLKMDERYQAGSAYMVLGQVYLQAPRLLGGDTQKAIDNLEKGMRVGPDNALIRSHLAEAYAQANRPGDARKHCCGSNKVADPGSQRGNADRQPQHRPHFRIRPHHRSRAICRLSHPCSTLLSAIGFWLRQACARASLARRSALCRCALTTQRAPSLQLGRLKRRRAR